MSADGRRWFLLNASPDVHAQLARLPNGRDGAVRHAPIEGIALTDAELDHTLGIALLREAGALALYATDAALGTLERTSRLLPVTRAFAAVDATILVPGGPAAPLRHRDGRPSGLSVAAVEVAGDPPRFEEETVPGHTVGLFVHDGATGGTCAYVPGCGALDDALKARLAAADLVLFDGTFFTEDEMQRQGLGQRTASQMGHVPVGGARGTLAALGGLPSRHRVYTHINNTNPMLIEDSPEHQAVERAGVLIGRDGMTFEI